MKTATFIVVPTLSKGLNLINPFACFSFQLCTIANFLKKILLSFSVQASALNSKNSVNIFVLARIANFPFFIILCYIVCKRVWERERERERCVFIEIAEV